MNKQEVIPVEKYFLTDEESREFCDETGQLARGMKSAFMLLAQRLYKIREKKLYQKAGYDTFWEYREDVLKIENSIVSKLINLYEFFVVMYGVDFESIQNSSYTKLYLVKPLIEKKSEIDEWLQKEKDLPNSEFKKEVKQAKIKKFGKKDIEDCEHIDTHLIRVCNECAESWAEYQDTDLKKILTYYYFNCENKDQKIIKTMLDELELFDLEYLKTLKENEKKINK